MEHTSRSRLSAAGAVTLALTFGLSNLANQDSEKPIVVEGGLMTPESALHDPAADVYLVFDIDGNPSARDGNGFISRVAPDGSIRELKWIDGAREGVTLNAPKGMALRGNTLLVADLDAIRLFDRASGKPWHLGHRRGDVHERRRGGR